MNKIKQTWLQLWRGLVDRLSKRSRQQGEQIFLYQSPNNEELFNPTIIRTISIIFIVLLFAFIFLASITTINEAAVANGIIEPEDNIIQLQHFDGGVVTQIHTSEGDIVEQGQKLLTLDGIGANEDLQRYLMKNLSLELQQERVQSILMNREPDFEKIVKDQVIIKNQMRIYQDMLEAAKSEKAVIKTQIEQQEFLLQSIISKQKHFAKEIKIGQEVMAMYQKLAVNGHTSKVKLLEEKRRVSEMERQKSALAFEEKKLERTVDEYKSRLRSYDDNRENRLNQQLEKIAESIKENRELVKKLKKKATRLVLRSPVSGIVKSKRVHSIGEPIHPGNVLFEIVPLSTPLIATINISPNDIGHVRLGEMVRIKVSAFDYIKYGVIEGTLYQISAGTFVDNQDKSYYKGKVKLTRNYIPMNSGKKYLMPGMLITAEVITGDRTILEYLLKPIYRSFDGGLTER